MRNLFGKPGTPWLASALAACLFLLATLAVPLWKMELIAPQYPEGLVMYAYGYKFAGDPSSHYDDVREINGLNHYIGMKPIVEVTEMQLFIPGVLALATATLIVSFLAWKRKLLRGLTIASFWFLPLFFLADLQYWLYHYGHTMDPNAPLNTGPFTPKVVGTTSVWNFHSENSLQPGFYLMVLAAATISFGPPLLRRLSAHLARGRERAARQGQAAAGPERVGGRAAL
jgi:hypothetical protein